jgi:hypothetical protein
VQPMKGLVVFGVAALVIASCGGNERSAATVPAVVTTSAADTTAPTTTSSPPSSTSTTAAAAATATLPATTTTVATEDLIKQAVQAYSAAYHACGVEPAACVPDTFTAVSGRSRSTVTEFVQGLMDQGLYFSPDQRGSYVTAESVSIDSPSEATAVFCVFDAGTVLGPDGPDGVPTLVNDQIVSLRDEYQLFFENGSWLVGEKQELEHLGEGSLCPPAE